MTWLPFNRPHATGSELGYIRAAIDSGHLSGNGAFTERCCRWLEERTGAVRALLTHSCTGALEMAALLAEVGPGDEVIMPSFTFVSTANAFVLRGATPVFVDIRSDTMNIAPELVAAAITERTRAIVPVHYAGVGCDMDALSRTASRHGLAMIEDAAQGLMASFRGRQLGSFGVAAAVSFHETKNVISGEGGALLLNDPSLVERAEILQEKGTDRSRFFRGEIDKYTWVDVGSSYLPSEINAAFLWAQLEQADLITRQRLDLWDAYHALMAPLEDAGRLRRPVVPPDVEHNAHMYFVLLPDEHVRESVIAELREHNVHSVFHYVPLHSSPAGRRFGREGSGLEVTDDVSRRLLRLPLWVGMTQADVERVAAAVTHALEAKTVSQ
jgi:dTDP-4-amino-4,6-dideoxygalactose transaminase